MSDSFYTKLAISLIQSFNGGGGNRTRVRRYSTEGFYMLILFLILVSQLLKRKDTMRPALNGFRLPCSGRTRFAILRVGAPQALQESARETACLQTRQQLAVVLHLIVFHLFSEVDGASTCYLSLNYLRRIQFAPVISRLNYISPHNSCQSSKGSRLNI